MFRRALESVAPDVETIGFAGFFGFPIEYVPLGHTHGGAQCPVLLAPKFTVREAVRGADAEMEAELLGMRLMRAAVRQRLEVVQDSPPFPPSPSSRPWG